MPRVPALTVRPLHAPPLLLRPWQAATDLDTVLTAAALGLVDILDPLLPGPPGGADGQLLLARAWCDGGTAWLGEQAPWAIAVARDPGRALGGVTVHGIDPAAGDAELGYWLLPAARGHGWAALALARATTAARTAGLEQLHVRHAAGNEASCRTAVNAGYDTVVEAPDGGHDHRPGSDRRARPHA